MEKSYFSPNDFRDASDSRKIQAAINAARDAGLNEVIIPRHNAQKQSTVWTIDETILLPSHMTVVIDNAHLRMADGATLKIAVGSSGAGCVEMTSTDARVRLEGASLDIQMMSGAIRPMLAGVTILDNRGSLPVEGRFEGLPEGGEIELVNGRKATISYVGGDGNDIVLAIRDRGTLLQLR